MDVYCTKIRPGLALILIVFIGGHVSPSTAASTAIETKWFGLGERACFGHTCKFGQYCSNATSLGGYCRDCDDMLAWCQGEANRDIFKREKPGCYYICERLDKELLAQQLSRTEEQLSNCSCTGTTCTDAGFAWDWRHSVLLVGIAAAVLLISAICQLCLRWRRNQEARCRANDDPEIGGKENGDEETHPLNPTAPLAPDNTDNGSAVNDSGNVSVNSSAENVNTDNTTPMSNTPSASGGSGTRYPTKVSESQQSINAEVSV